MESEATSATTRQYPSQQPANPYDAPYQSQFAQARSAPDYQFGGQTPDTSRLYETPMAPPNYPDYPANYQQAAAKKSGSLKWILITLTCIALVSGGISALVISAIHTKQTAAQRAREKLLKEIEPPHFPPPPPPPPASRAALEQYKYPNAEVKNSVGAFGNDVLTMITSDSVSEVGDYYRKKLGAPMVEDDGSIVFQIAGSPMTLITIDKDDGGSDKTQITIVRTGWSDWPFPKRD